MSQERKHSRPDVWEYGTEDAGASAESDALLCAALPIAKIYRHCH